MARAQKAVLIDAVTALHEQAGIHVARASALLGLARSSYNRLAHNYQHYQPVERPIPHTDRSQPAALSETERRVIIDLILAEENSDRSVVQTYWRSFDEGLVACSERTFYRVARSQNLTGDRRRTRRGGSNARPKPVVATAQVGQLWSWDITMLQGPRKQDRYLLYLAIDVFSRYPVAWRIEYAETTQMAVQMFLAAFEKYGVPLVLHADNGASMRSTGLLDALESAGVSASYSRPRVSDDNPFSESLFKTLKYDSSCPERFDDIGHAREWTEQFLHRYANEHRHGGLSRHTPAAVFFGTAAAIRRYRQDRLDRIWTEHPERFRRRPQAPELPQLTGINIKHDLSQAG